MDSSKLFLLAILLFSSMANILEVSADGPPAAAHVSLQCMEKVAPCQPYLNSSSPPPSCCTPLKSMVDGEDGGANCVCQVFNNPDILKSFNVTKDAALKLPKACGFTVDLSICNNETSTSSTAPASAPSKSEGSHSLLSDIAKGLNATGKGTSDAADGRITLFVGGNGFFMSLLLTLFVSAVL